MRVRTIGGVGLAIGLATAATAQGDRLGSKTLDELATCKAIASDAARLACFDRASGRIAAARASGDLLALDREKVVENKRRAFGLGGEGAAPLGGGAIDRSIAVTQVDTKIVSVKEAGYARFRMQLANNTVWETIDPTSFAPRVGTAITLKRASLGGYRATIGDARSILVKRIR